MELKGVLGASYPAPRTPFTFSGAAEWTQETIPGRLPPFVVYRDGTPCSVHNIEIEGEHFDWPVLLLVPMQAVNAREDGEAASVIRCYAESPATLYAMLDNDNELLRAGSHRRRFLDRQLEDPSTSNWGP